MRAMPSPTDSTCPTSATSASLPKLAICCFRIAEISAARISIVVPLPMSSADAAKGQPQPLQLAAQRPVDHARADLDDHAAEQSRIDADVDRHPPPDRAPQLVPEECRLRLAERLRRGHLGGH